MCKQTPSTTITRNLMQAISRNYFDAILPFQQPDNCHYGLRGTNWRGWCQKPPLVGRRLGMDHRYRYFQFCGSSLVPGVPARRQAGRSRRVSCGNSRTLVAVTLWPIKPPQHLHQILNKKVFDNAHFIRCQPPLFFLGFLNHTAKALIISTCPLTLQWRVYISLQK